MRKSHQLRRSSVSVKSKASTERFRIGDKGEYIYAVGTAFTAFNVYTLIFLSLLSS